MKRNPNIDNETHFKAYNLTMPGAWWWNGGATYFLIKNYRLRGSDFKTAFPKHVKPGNIHASLNALWGEIIWN
jgi:hypothetical protein